MKTKKTYESNKLHGVYRCGKREDYIKKIPRPNDENDNDSNVIDIIISYVMNFGSNTDAIKSFAKDTFGCENLIVPYNELNIAKEKLAAEIITRKLMGSLVFSVDDVVNSFYSFADMPTDTTRELQAEADIMDIKRYLSCEERNMIICQRDRLTLCEADFMCTPTMMFDSHETVKINKRKVGRKYVYDEAEYEVIEAVRLFASKPAVKASSKIIDAGVTSRLELYVMLKYLEKWCKDNNKSGSNIMLKASYYYLKKTSDSSTNYSDDFFEKGGNVVSLQTSLSDISTIDEFFEPQLREFLSGNSLQEENCDRCKMSVFCKYKEAVNPLEESNISLSKEVRPLPTLSNAQQEAASALSGNVRVIATAGSGKTTTMAYRIMNLIKAGVAPEKIGCFTFTNAGAKEMEDRIRIFCIAAGLKCNVDKITVSTIHSFGDSLLKKYFKLLGYKNPPTLINEIQKTKIIEKILSENPVINELKLKYKDFYMDMFRAQGILETMKTFFDYISSGMDEDTFKEKTCLSDETVKLVYALYAQYDSYKLNLCLIEHDDQELGVLKLLELKPDLFEEVGFEHVSVDEYQDTSNIQFKIIDAIRKAKCLKSLFIVGDDDQSIYSFRDANVELIKDFFDMIGDSNGVDISLMENRRSTGNIVSFAAELIKNNKNRIEKNPISTNEKGCPVSVETLFNKEDEREYIVNHIVDLINSGVSSNDIAILTPTNDELLLYEDMLREQGIESVSINPEPTLKNSNVLASISLVKFILNDKEVDGMNFINALDKGALIAEADESIKGKIESLRAEVSELSSVDELFDMFKTLDATESDEIYQSYLKDVQQASKGTLKEVFEYIMDYERFGKKQTARKEKKYNGVVLSTMHSSKGKEWPIVFCSVTKLHSSNMTEADIQEKNRLLFVACTRAKKELYISGVALVGSSKTSGDVENMFLEECIETKNMLFFTDVQENSEDGMFII